jgi:hypothetical protein
VGSDGQCSSKIAAGNDIKMKLSLSNADGIRLAQDRIHG